MIRLRPRLTSSGQSIRVLPELRPVQIEQNAQMVPAETWYLAENYDLRGTSIPDHFIKVSPLGAAWRLLTTRATVLEVPEPLWARFLPTNLLLVATWRVAGFLRFRRQRARAYAIENNTPVGAILGDRKVPTVIRGAITFSLGLFVWLSFERIAFGTPGAQAAYRMLSFSRRLESQLILGLPARDLNPPADQPSTPILAFVGSLHRRKGIDTLMHAWETVEATNPGLEIAIIGTGPLEDEVVRWVSSRPATRRFLGQLARESIAPILASCTAVVVPSRRYGRWREQVGLPIEEGLSLGLTVVSSDETGLADWLRLQGHHVVPARELDAALAAEISAALTTPLSRSQVVESLPAEHARVTADRWLHS